MMLSFPFWYCFRDPKTVVYCDMLAFPPIDPGLGPPGAYSFGAGHHADRDLRIAIGREIMQSSHTERLFFI